MLKWFSCDCERNAQEHLTNAKLIIVFTLNSPNSGFPPYSEVNKWLTKVKEKLSTIQFDIFGLSFIFFIPISLMACHQLSMFGVHKHNDGGDMILVCHVISHDRRVM